MHYQNKNHALILAGYDKRHVVTIPDGAFASNAFSAGVTGPTNWADLGGLICHRTATGLKPGQLATAQTYLTIAPTSRQDIGGAAGGSPITDTRCFINALPNGKKHTVLSLAQGLKFATPAYASGDTFVLDSQVSSPTTTTNAGLAKLWTSGPRVGFAQAAPAYIDQNAANSLVIDTNILVPTS